MFEHLYILAGLLGGVGVVLAILFFRPSRKPSIDRRGAPRIAPPPDCAVVTVEGAPYPLKNWSATGFLAEPYQGKLDVGQKCVINIQVRQNPFNIAFGAEALIVRKGARELAGRFIFLPPDDKGQIEAYFAYHAQMR